MLFNRLINRGHNASLLQPIFKDAIQKKLIQHTSGKPTKKEIASVDDTINFHCRFNPGDPPLQQIHQLFQKYIIEPYEGFNISTLEANKPNSFVTLQKIRPIPHKQRTLRAILSPTRHRFSDVLSVANYMHSTYALQAT